MRVFERGLENQAQLRRIDRAVEVGIAARFHGLLFDRTGTRAAERDQDQATLQDAQFPQDADTGMGIVTLCIDIDQHCLRPLFADPDGGVPIVIAVAHLVPRRQLCLDLSLKVLVRRDQADRRQCFLGVEGRWSD